MKLTKETKDKLIGMFNEVFESIGPFDGKLNCAFYILKNGNITLDFDEPIKGGLKKLYYKIRPSLWARIKEAF